MGQAIEKLNNAISSLEVEANRSNASEETKRAIHELGEHWGKFWQSNERLLMPDVVLEPKLQSYVAWYTRAWVLAPPDVRNRVTRPDQIDVSWQSLAYDALRQHLDSTGQVVEKAGTAIASGAKDIVIVLGGIAIVMWFLTRDA